MKITTTQLKQIIREEIQKMTLNEEELKLNILKPNGLHTFFKQFIKSDSKINFSWEEHGGEATIKFRNNAPKKTIEDFKNAVKRSSTVSLK